MTYRFDLSYQKLTFDLVYPEQLKADEYDTWVRRILWVSSFLNLDYFKLWEIPEHEFEMLENKAFDEYKKQQQRLEAAKEGK